MAGSETDISISSQALPRLGDSPISSFNETFGAVTCGNVYPFVKRRVLVAYPWRVTMVKSQLLNKIVGSGSENNAPTGYGAGGTAVYQDHWLTYGEAGNAGAVIIRIIG